MDVQCKESNLVVIVDNDPTSVRIMKIFLKDSEFGLDPRAFFFSSDAKNFLLGKDGPRVKLLVTDVEMPVISGIELTKAAKIKNPGIKVICISASDLREDCQRAGCDCFIQKPLGFSKFKKAIESIS